MCSPRNSPAKSNGGLVKNNEIYKPRSFRVQRQRPAPRAAENNNEYQAKNKDCGHGQEHLCGSWNPGGAATRAKQSPVRSPARAHFVSFNFTNTTIRRVPSTSVIDVGKKNVEQNRSRSRFGIAFGAPCRCRASSGPWALVLAHRSGSVTRIVHPHQVMLMQPPRGDGRAKGCAGPPQAFGHPVIRPAFLARNK